MYGETAKKIVRLYGYRDVCNVTLLILLLLLFVRSFVYLSFHLFLWSPLGVNVIYSYVALIFDLIVLLFPKALTNSCSCCCYYYFFFSSI